MAALRTVDLQQVRTLSGTAMNAITFRAQTASMPANNKPQHWSRIHNNPIIWAALLTMASCPPLPAAPPHRVGSMATTWAALPHQQTHPAPQPPPARCHPRAALRQGPASPTAWRCMKPRGTRPRPPPPSARPPQVTPGCMHAKLSPGALRAVIGCSNSQVRVCPHRVGTSQRADVHYCR